LTPPTSPKAIDVLTLDDAIVDSLMKHVQVEKVVCELPSKLNHNLQVEDAIEGHGYQEQNAQRIANRVLVHISKEITIPQFVGMCS
jgi:TFIIF-interacting CTD phosphatase-like protein